MAMDRKKDSKEFTRLLSKLVASNSYDEVCLFKENFQVFLLEKLFDFPKPLGDLFKKGIIVSGCKGGQRERSSKPSSGSSSSGTLDSSISVSELDVTGSPLECVFDSILLEEGSSKALCSILKSPRTASTVRPLPVPDAMYILELCSLCSVPALEEVPLFVLCDGRDQQHTILKGICRKEKNSRFMLTCKGPYSKRADLPTFESIKNSHQKFYNSAVETSAYAHYDIVGCPISSTTSALKPCKEGALAVKCSWTNVSSVLQMPTADASCELIYKQGTKACNENCGLPIPYPWNLKRDHEGKHSSGLLLMSTSLGQLVLSVPGDDHSGAYARYKELKLVQALASSLHTGKVAWPNTEPDEKLFVNLRDLISGENDAIVRKMTQQNELPANSSDFKESFEASVTGNRKDMDFTDQLWTVLAECSSYQELIRSLEFVFGELKNATISPVVYRKNTTTIGKFVRNMSKESTVYPSLESTKPVQLLLEMGVEKLQKDYLMIFVGLELCPYDSIVPYIQEDKLSAEAVNCLAKLHAILELTVLCWTHLSLPKLILNSVVRSALKYYTSLPTVDPTYIFKFPISMLHVKTAIEKFEPTEWQVSVASKCNTPKYDQQTVLHFATHPFLQSEPLRRTHRIPGSPLMTRKSYYCTTASLVEDDFPI